MENIKLNAYSRTSQPELKAVVAAELYGPGVTNQHLFLDEAVLDKILSKANRATLIDLAVDEQSAVPVLIREIQREPIKDKVLHVDFLQVDPKQKVVVQIDLEPVGKSLAISNLGATLVKNMQTLKIECLPDQIVSKLEVDLGKLVKVDDVIRVGDLVVPDGIVIKNHPREAVFSLVASRKGRVNRPEANAETAPTAAGDASAKEATPAKKEKK